MRRFVFAVFACMAGTSISTAEESVYQTDFGAWRFMCQLHEDLPDDCRAAQGVRDTRDASRWIRVTLSLREEKGDAALYFTIPRPKVTFEPRDEGGVVVVIDAYKGTLHLNEDVCSATECVIDWRLDTPSLVRLGSSKEMFFIFPIEENRGLGLSISLDGFAESYLALLNVREANESKKANTK